MRPPYQTPQSLESQRLGKKDRTSKSNATLFQPFNCLNKYQRVGIVWRSRGGVQIDGHVGLYLGGGQASLGPQRGLDACPEGPAWVNHRNSMWWLWIRRRRGCLGVNKKYWCQ